MAWEARWVGSAEWNNYEEVDTLAALLARMDARCPQRLPLTYLPKEQCWIGACGQYEFRNRNLKEATLAKTFALEEAMTFTLEEIELAAKMVEEMK